jgi:dTDP-4-amino-4,6-dideoxygalactose transaminase
MSDIAFSPPDLGTREQELMLEALRSGWITTGPMTERLEDRLSELCGTPRTICLNSGTAALELALRLLEVGPGDEVITSAYTYSATAAVICHVGARPVLADTPPGRYHLDAARVRAVLTPATKAVIAVDIAGEMCDYPALRTACGEMEFCPRSVLQGLLGRPALIADAAHSLGARKNGVPSGRAADLTAFSFHAVKNLTTAEGGALTWYIPGADDESLYRRLSLLSLHGQTKSARQKEKEGWRYDIPFPGYKYNMTDLAAALGLAQMERFAELLGRRRRLDTLYNELLVGVAEPLRHGKGSSRHLCMVRLPFDDEERRDRVIRRMGEEGVAVNVHYRPLPDLTAYRSMGFDPADYPCAMENYRREISLPLHTRLSEGQVERVAFAFKRAVEAEGV